MPEPVPELAAPVEADPDVELAPGGDAVPHPTAAKTAADAAISTKRHWSMGGNITAVYGPPQATAKGPDARVDDFHATTTFMVSGETRGCVSYAEIAYGLRVVQFVGSSA